MSRPGRQHEATPKHPDERQAQVLLIATGSDHPGILDDIGNYITDRRGHIDAVRVTNLHGKFALLVLVGGDEECLRHLAADLHLLMERTGVRATLEIPDDPATGHAASTRFRLRAGGQEEGDETGTLRQITNLLRVLNTNILDVNTDRTPGEGFEIRLLLDVPRDVPVSKLRELLGQLLNREHIQWELSAEVGED